MLMIQYTYKIEYSLDTSSGPSNNHKFSGRGSACCAGCGINGSSSSKLSSVPVKS